MCPLKNTENVLLSEDKDIGSYFNPNASLEPVVEANATFAALFEPSGELSLKYSTDPVPNPTE